jgi:hypothetical protein
MRRNQKLTPLLKGRIARDSKAAVVDGTTTVTLIFDDASQLAIRVAPDFAPPRLHESAVEVVRQSGTDLLFDLEDQTSLNFVTAEESACVLLRDKNGKMEYAD